MGVVVKLVICQFALSSLHRSACERTARNEGVRDGWLFKELGLVIPAFQMPRQEDHESGLQCEAVSKTKPNETNNEKRSGYIGQLTVLI